MSLLATPDIWEEYKILSQNVRAFGENIPPLINAYMNLSPSLKTFGTVINPLFGEVEETAILITINDLYKQKVERHIASYAPQSKYQIFRALRMFSKNRILLQYGLRFQIARFVLA